MGLISYLLHQGFVRVAFVPIVMGVLLYGLYVLAAPTTWRDEDEQGGSA
jgi:hypothetical protein